MKMKVKCLNCKVERELEGDTLQDVSKMVAKDPDMDTTDFLRILNIIDGKRCYDGKRHAYTFHEEFDNYIDEVAKTLDLKEGDLQAKELEEDKIEELIPKLEKQLEEAKARMEVIPAEKEAIKLDIQTIKAGLEEATGLPDIKIWTEEIKVKG